MSKERGEKMKVLYVVVPCYNEEEVLEETTRQLKEKMESLIKDKKISKKESKPKTTFAIMKKLERDIDKKENKRKELETKLFDKEIYTNITKVNEINDMIEKLTKEIENLYDEWENISE